MLTQVIWDLGHFEFGLELITEINFPCCSFFRTFAIFSLPSRARSSLNMTQHNLDRAVVRSRPCPTRPTMTTAAAREEAGSLPTKSSAPATHPPTSRREPKFFLIQVLFTKTSLITNTIILRKGVSN